MAIDRKGVVLTNGVILPWIGLGTWQIEDGEPVARAVRTAVEMGYRSIDTAQVYGNEAGVGLGIRTCGVPREELFVASKMDCLNQGYDQTLWGFDASLKRMGLEWLDLFMLHWPMRSSFVDTWRAIVRLYQEGRVRATGVSNCLPQHLELLEKETGARPMVDQFECHPRLSRKALVAYCRERGIVTEAYSPLMQGELSHPTLMALSEKHAKSPAQIVLRWHLQNGVAAVPKASGRERIEQNGNVFDFHLDISDMQAMDDLNDGTITMFDPSDFPFDA